MVHGGVVVLGSFADLCVVDVARSVAFYRSLVGLEVIVDHGWYAELGTGLGTGIGTGLGTGLGDAGRTLLALVERGHETVPAVARVAPRGVLVSFEVDDAAAAAASAVRLGVAVLVGLVTELGQRHLMVEDPDGAVVDVIERVRMTAADVRRLVGYRRRAARS